MLVISGAQTATPLAVPSGVDFLVLPALEPRSAGSQEPRGRDRDRRSSGTHRRALRSRILQAALDESRPDLFLVEEFPRDAEQELEAALRSVRARPDVRCLLGLGDVAPDPEAARRAWSERGYADAICESFDRILVYGDRAVYDRVREDRMPVELEDRIRYTGYLVRDAGRTELAPPAERDESGEPFVLCTLGGGDGGFQLGRAFCHAKLPPGPVGVLLAGPLLPPAQHRELQAFVSARTDLRMLDFVSDPMSLIQRARRVISVGGYATVTELLRFGKRTLIVTGGTRALERRIRAERLEALGLVDVLEPHLLGPEALGDWLQRPLPWPPSAWEQLDLGGLARLPHLIQNA